MTAKPQPEYKIESGIPMPATRGSYPFGEMKVGDSFSFPANAKKRVRDAAINFGMRYKKKFTVRGTRIWRVK